MTKCKTPSVSQIAQQVHNKFTNYVQTEVDQWKANEAIREKQELGHVMTLLLYHEENCRRIYILSIIMGIFSLFFYTFSSFGILQGGLSWILVGVLILQLITINMWPVLFRVLRTYAPYITLPFAGLVGIVGYNMENLLSDKFTPYQKSISQQRKERQEAEVESSYDDVSSLKERKFLARTVFEKNLSPSLQN